MNGLQILNIMNSKVSHLDSDFPYFTHNFFHVSVHSAFCSHQLPAVGGAAAPA